MSKPKIQKFAQCYLFFQSLTVRYKTKRFQIFFPFECILSVSTHQSFIVGNICIKIQSRSRKFKFFLKLNLRNAEAYLQLARGTIK